MPRLKNKANGAVINVSAATAKRLGPEWESADVTPKPRAKKSESSDS